MTEAIEIPWQALATDTLQAVVEEFVTREGTDYGFEVSLDKKVEQVIAGIRRGDYLILYDPETTSVQILTQQQWQSRG